ncbi:lysophospholipase [Halomonas sp. H5]|uniref:alpha/beta hydrolase n=1 Tax=Halomonas sp. H5 TaxID=3423910 RepID=UPI003D36C426
MRLPWLTALLAFALSGCATQGASPSFDLPPPYAGYVEVAEDRRLPYRQWLPAGEPRALVLALHGFNDHAGSFTLLGEALSARGIALYAYDQRGFGTTGARGHWPGEAALVADTRAMLAWLEAQYPTTPRYLLGKSMGAAVALRVLAERPPVAGGLLVAPAVWGRNTMPWYQRLGLWLGMRLAPEARFSARTARRLGIEPTDDPEIRRQLARDPLLLRSARIEALDGVARLMDAALAAAPDQPGPLLLLYGEADQVIPEAAVCTLLADLPPPPAWRLALYPEGYHMLTRYRGRAQTEADLAAWLRDPAAPLPSGQEVTQEEAERRLCR